MRNLILLGLAAILFDSQAIAQMSPPAPNPFSRQPASITQIPQSAPTGLTSSLTSNIPATAKEPAVPLTENIRNFDPNTLNLTWMNNRWYLTAGSVVLKDFGRKEEEGRQALRLARQLRLNQYASVGTPAPLIEYWLSDGRAPQGMVTGYPIVDFEIDSLRIEKNLDQWCIRDDNRMLFNFGPNSGDAHQVFAILRKYDFTRVAIVGQLMPSMMVFLSRTDVGTGKPSHRLVSGENPETAAQKAEKMKNLKERFPGLGSETVMQPALRPLHTPNQPNQPFNSSVEGRDASNGFVSKPLQDCGNRVPFDWRQVQVRQDGNDWKLMAGSFVLANFGPDQDTARRALDVVRYYRFTEQCFVGRPQPCFSYFLVNGQAPRGKPFGVFDLPFQPDMLKVCQVRGNFALCDGAKVLLTLGNKPQEATELLEIIRRQHFDRLCHLKTEKNGDFTFLAKAW